MSEFISNVLKLLSGSIIAQIFAIVLIPIITRLYSPEDYGLFSLILAITGIIVIFSSLSYQLTIMLPKEDENAAYLVVLCCILILVSSFITGLFILLFANQIADILHAPAIADYLWPIPIIILLTALFSVFTYWNSRRKRFGVYAIANIVNSIAVKGIQISVGIISASVFSLILGYILGNICSILVMLKGFSEDISLFRLMKRRKLKDLAIRYKKFPLLNSFSTTANTISTQVTPLIFSFFFGPTVVGFYSIALSVVSMPMTLIGNAIGQVFFQKASEEKNKTGNIKNIVTELHQRLFKIGIFPTFLLIILGSNLFSVIFGDAWTSAGLFAAILAPWFFLVFITSPLSTLFTVFERLEIVLAINFVVLLSRLIVLIIGGMLGNVILALILFSLTGVIFIGGSNYYLLKIAGVDISNEIKMNFIIFLKAISISIPLIIAYLFNSPQYFLFGVSGILLFLYYSIIIKEDPLLKTKILEIIKN